MAGLTKPYAFGRRLLADSLAELADTEPSRIYASIPRTANLADGFRDVSFQDMERMSGALTAWIREFWGPSSSFETVAYLGIPDLRSAVVFFAAVRNGYKLFLPSPRNVSAVNAALMEQTQCSKIIYASEIKSAVDEICNLVTVTTLAAPSLDEILNMEPADTLPSKRSFEKAKNDPILVLHSSGSTGLPKPITMTNYTFAVLDNERFLPTVEGRVNRDFSIWDFEGGGKFFTVFPYFHLAGFLSLVVNPVFTEASSPVIGPALSLPSGVLMKEILDQQKVRALYIPPSIAEQLLAEPNGLDFFRELDFICYTGGPFSPIAGEKLVQVTNLVPLYGSTEAFQTPQLVPSKEDWAYMEWNPHFKHEMQLAEDGAFELVLFSDASTEKMSALNHNVPNTSEWRTRDLFKRHPRKPNLWQYYGRRDDIIVFSNGEKFNPVPMELTIGSNKLLNGVLVIGDGRTQTSLFLEPKRNVDMDGAKLVEELWPLIKSASSAAPAQGRIAYTKVHVVAPGALVRTGKGTVIRKLSEKKLNEELKNLYKEPPVRFTLTKTDESSIEEYIREILTDTFMDKVGIDDDLFALGLDSVKSAEIMRNISLGVKPLAETTFKIDFVYQNPSIRLLSKAVWSTLTSGASPDAPIFQDEIKSMIVKYAHNFYTSSFPKPMVLINPTIAITGSTGALGSAVLQLLVKNYPEVKILALNRRRDLEHEAKNSGQIRFLEVHLDEDLLGLGESEYEELLASVDIIVHNAWQVDFSLPLKAFERQLQGVRNLVNWSIRSPKRPRIVYCSSVSSVMDWPRSSSKTLIPEMILDEHSSPLKTGYAGSKFVAEHILAAASTQRNIDVKILRLGQIVQTGDFSLGTSRMGRSWVPQLLQTSKTLNCFPVDICDIDWLTLNEACAIILELVMAPQAFTKEGQFDVYNLVNPMPCGWDLALPLLHQHDRAPSNTVSLKTWLHRLEAALADNLADANDGLPSSKILSFFHALENGKRGLRYNTKGAEATSAQLRAIQPVTSAKILGWIELE